jgi:hypothetical protein
MVPMVTNDAIIAIGANGDQLVTMVLLQRWHWQLWHHWHQCCHWITTSVVYGTIGHH